MIKLIVDSTCDLPERFLNEYDIRVVPLHIILGDKEYRDNLDIRTDEIYAHMRNGEVPLTSQVSADDLYNLFDEYCSRQYDFIYLSFSSGMSGSCQAAESVIGEFRERYRERKMEVVDSKAGSMASGLIALQGARMIRQGYDFDTIFREMTDMAEHIEHIFTITDLKWLIRGGRVDRLQGMIGSLLNVKPILDVKDGSIKLIKKVRGHDNALKEVVNILAERIGDFSGQIIGITHADDEGNAEAVKRLIAERVGAKEFIVNRIGSVLGVHLGIGGIGVFFFNTKPACYIG